MWKINVNGWFLKYWGGYVPLSLGSPPMLSTLTPSCYCYWLWIAFMMFFTSDIKRKYWICRTENCHTFRTMIYGYRIISSSWHGGCITLFSRHKVLTERDCFVAHDLFVHPNFHIFNWWNNHTYCNAQYFWEVMLLSACIMLMQYFPLRDHCQTMHAICIFQ